MNPPWLQTLLERTDVTDICMNGSGEIFVDSGSGMAPESARWSEDEQRAWALDQLLQAGKSWDARHPFVDATLHSGHRLHVAFPPVARQGVLISLRRLGTHGRSGGEARWSGALYDRLAQAVCEGDSVLIAGATGSGKTTLANDLLSLVSPSERIVALEDTPELAPRHPHFVSLVSRPPNADGFGEVTLRTLMKQTLRMRPDRIILGECRGSEVLELLQALNTGHRGALATLHANSPRDALRRIELLCLLAAEGQLALGVIRELLAVGIQWVAQVRRDPSPAGGGASRRISELWRIEGREGDTILMRPMIN
jgi:pilus assembly protein CpaF